MMNEKIKQNKCKNKFIKKKRYTNCYIANRNISLRIVILGIFVGTQCVCL